MLRILIGLFVLSAAVASPVFAIQTEEEFAKRRNEMVDKAVAGAGVKNERILQAMRDTRRHEFMPKKMWDQAYLDAGVAIGKKQTISSPFIVAYMTESVDPQPEDRVLEIGTGSGYQAAILSPLVKEVYSIEIVEELGKTAAKTLERLEYKNVFTKIGDGYKGWEEHAPFDKIIVTCSPENVPQPLVDQLAEGGMMVVPVGERHQQVLYLFTKENGELVEKALRPTLFVPMTGQAEDERQIKPDPANPELHNADFEDGLDDAGFVSGWYYERLLEWKAADDAPSGEHFIEFKNDVPGQYAHLMQGFDLDGRMVSKLDFGAMVKYSGVVNGPGEYDMARMAVTFYDKDRREIGTEYFGPFVGTQAGWRSYEKEISVPRTTREAIFRIGMFGATVPLHSTALS
ncbi:MAG: protein-L-isoaspartate(D-aspartate) O-methyltransferase [Pirellulaceae bacterium]